MEYVSTFVNKLIYIYRINDKAHQGCVKIGETTAPDGLFAPNSRELNQAAKLRINQCTVTAGISYELLHTELTLFFKGGRVYSFNDKKVHDILVRSGIKKKKFELDAVKSQEWFICDLETAKKAVEAAKTGQGCLDSSQISSNKNPIEFRPEQKRAIEQTKRVFKKGNEMLWNAKMRMGKTLTSLQVVKDLNFTKTIIVTHRPVVDEGWFDDFNKIFFEGNSNFAYGSKDKGVKGIANLDATGRHYVYFASMQDLRGSKRVGGTFDKNEDVFDTKWECLIIDEAHEGTQTELGQKVIDELKKQNQEIKMLNLSGTPFNLLDDFDEDKVFTWDYVMEQQAKKEWYEKHPDDPNPYEELPKLNILTFDLGKLNDKYCDEDKAFNFREFFKVWSDAKTLPNGAELGGFVHKNDVEKFLDLISDDTISTLYPFCTPKTRDLFRHTFWIIPGVREGKALAEMLRHHKYFGQYQVINVAGDEDDETQAEKALQEVQNKMTDHPENTHTITISCGKLTTGVTIRPWTAVMYLTGGVNTSAQTYMQTIFRVQSPAVIAGRQKTECYVFDFAPDRTLKVIAEVAKISAKAGSTTKEDRDILSQFLNYCPIISCSGTTMKHYNVEQMMQQLKRVYVDKVVSSGFEDGHLYSDKLLRLTDLEIYKFNDLCKIIGRTKAAVKTNTIDVNTQGFSEEEIQKQQEEYKQKENRALSAKEAEAVLEANKRKKQRDTAISILRGISIRMPLILYGAKLKKEDEHISLDRFVELVDDASWQEFMPQGVTKEKFNDYKEYYDEDIFAAAGKQIRAMALAADRMPVLQRIMRITDIFNAFRNPDKETVLTPWRVVNMHLSDCIGGYCFYDDKFENQLIEPRCVDRGLVTQRLFENPDVRILEINSKSGLYPLYMAYGIYRHKLRLAETEKARTHLVDKSLSMEEEYEIWNSVIAKNIFVICKTDMARSITIRTLTGFTGVKVNTHVYDDLINQITNKQTEFINRLLSGSIFKQIRNNMKFDAIIGNPPYQIIGGSGGNNDAPIYQHFANIATKLNPKYISLIMPSRWFAAGRENLLGDFRKRMLTCGKIQRMIAYSNGSDLFSNVEIKGGLCYYLENSEYMGMCNYSYIQDGIEHNNQIDLSEFDIMIRDPRLVSIVKKVRQKITDDNVETVDTIISADTPFGIPSNPRKSTKTPFVVYTTKTDKHDVLLYHIENNKRKVEYVALDDIEKNRDDIDKPKVFIPGAYGAGESFPHQILGIPECSAKHSVCSQSYLYASFVSDEEAHNFFKYIMSRFLRIMVLSIKITQSAPNRVYRFVPLQNFTSSSDIDWSKPVDEIDKQLYSKYNLEPDEISFIEKMIKPMS